MSVREIKNERKRDTKAQEKTIDRKKIEKGRWSQDEKARFIEAVECHGKDFQKIFLHVGTR